MDSYHSPSPRHLETPKFLTPENRDAEAPEAVSSHSSTLHTPKFTRPPPRPSTPPEVVPGDHGRRSCMKRATICGLAPVVFILVVALVIIIIGAAVGGGVGGTMAVRNARSEGLADGRASCSATVNTISDITTTASVSDPSGTVDGSGFEPPTNVVLALACPSVTSDMIPIDLHGKKYNFQLDCGVDRTADDINIIATMSYSLKHCLRACASYNGYNKNDKCVAVTFLADLSSLTGHGGNCYLKKKRGDRKEVEGEEQHLIVSAFLMEEE